MEALESRRAKFDVMKKYAKLQGWMVLSCYDEDCSARYLTGAGIVVAVDPSKNEIEDLTVGNYTSAEKVQDW